MFICGSNFIGGALACAITPTALDNIDYIALQNGLYDDLFVSKNTEFELTDTCPKEWDFDTVLYAPFQNSTNAGNVDWTLETISHLLLKKRSDKSFSWQTLAVKEIHSIDDFVINYPDYFAASGAPTEYAIVPVSNGVEGNYATSEITLSFDKLFLIEGDTVWSTVITDGFCDTTRNIPSSTIELLNHKYPVFVRNTIANYDTGTCSGAFVPMADKEKCRLAYGRPYDYQRTDYQRKFMDFLSDGIPKLLKMPDGRMWLIQVTPSPTDTANTAYNNRYVSFSWVEVGDVNSEEDLYYLGLSDVSEEWWNTSCLP